MIILIPIDFLTVSRAAIHHFAAGTPLKFIRFILHQGPAALSVVTTYVPFEPQPEFLNVLHCDGSRISTFNEPMDCASFQRNELHEIRSESFIFSLLLLKRITDNVANGAMIGVRE